VVGSRVVASLIVLVVFVAWPVDAESQFVFTGLLTGHIGAARSGDVGDATTTVGGSLAVIDNGGLGAEIDIAHTGAFDKEFFADSSITSFMLNFLAVYPKGKFRPFVNVGAGVLRIRTSLSIEQSAVGHTETGWDGGAGLYYVVNEFLSLRGDARYFRLFERPEDLVLRDSGFFDYWRLSVGATYSWPMR
jgi:opacity protein-like surface antigen